MFFEDSSQILEIARRNNCAIFVLPDKIEVNIPGAIILEPTNKTTIAIEQVRDVLGKLALRQAEDMFVLIRPADALGEEAANALLKSFEEPQEKVHFVLITEAPSRLLKTILSRSAIYFLRRKVDLEGGIDADSKQIELAKKMIVAKDKDLIKLANDLTRKKDGVREYVLSILDLTIEMLMKSYFKTGKEVFLQKLSKFINCYDAISRNGHIRLHLVADLI